MEKVSIVVQSRDVTGSSAARRLRKSGRIPGVLYGHGKEATMVAVEPHVMRAALSTSAGTHAVLGVTIEGTKGTRTAIIKEFTLHPTRGTATHFDMQEIRLDEVIESIVAVRFEGEAIGTKAGGVLDESLREVTVKGLPTDIPQYLVLDISGLDINDTAKVADLVVPENVVVMADPEQVLCSVLPPRKVEEEIEEGVEEAEPGVVGQEDADV
ncbi:MAG TPA: 50S ribosomal protein L25 [Thermoleophilia bacterium]|nr:50S ribosomal protein L25 [Thermoleophilia bacterium]